MRQRVASPPRCPRELSTADGRFVSPRTVSTADPEDHFAPTTLTAHDQATFEAIGQRIRR